MTGSFSPDDGMARWISSPPGFGRARGSDGVSISDAPAPAESPMNCRRLIIEQVLLLALGRDALAAPESRGECIHQLLHALPRRLVRQPTDAAADVVEHVLRLARPRPDN